MYTDIHLDFIGLNVLEKHNQVNAHSKILCINQMSLFGSYRREIQNSVCLNAKIPLEKCFQVNTETHR